MRVHTDDLRTHRNDIQRTYEWHKSTYDWHMNDIQIAYKWLDNDINNIKLYKGFGAVRSNFQKCLWWNHCFRWLQMIFGYYVAPIPILFIRSSTTGSGNLIERRPVLYHVARFNVIFLNLVLFKETVPSFQSIFLGTLSYNKD